MLTLRTTETWICTKMLSLVGQEVTGWSKTIFCLVIRYWASVQGRHQWRPGCQIPRYCPFLVTHAMTPSGLYKIGLLAIQREILLMRYLHCYPRSTWSTGRHHNKNSVTLRGIISKILYPLIPVSLLFKRLEDHRNELRWTLCVVPICDRFP